MATKKATKQSTVGNKVHDKEEAPAHVVKHAHTSTTYTVMTKDKGRALLPANIANCLLAEIIGTFILTLVALTTAAMGALYVGLALVVIVMAVGAISGAHVNPAVTLALWTVRKINWATGLAYWGAQFVGAMLAVAIANVASSGRFAPSFDFMAFSWPIFTVEMIGSAVFLFGLVAVLMREEISAGVKAFGIGLSLLVGIVAGGSLLSIAQSTAYEKYQSESSTATTPPALPHELLVKGAVLNPAVALAMTENTESQLMGGAVAKDEKQISRFGREVILGSLAGAVVGANLFVLVGYRPRKPAEHNE